MISSLRVAEKPLHDAIESETSFLKPLIFPSRTSHVRLFPKKHGFSYSYLLVGVPIGWRGSINSLLSADLDSIECNSPHRKRGWFSVNGADYLSRDYDANGLQGKLARYLKNQNEDLGDYPFVYLVTAPRFLGYSFNPVSFWYLYNKEKNLKAMILEVNNTFDERRVYFLKGSHQKASSQATDALRPLPDVDILLQAPNVHQENAGWDDKSTTKFNNSWLKDFHVSPFNSRNGSYALSAYDLLSQGEVNNTITLSSSKGHPKLVAKVFSTGASIDPSRMGTMATSRLVVAWCWVGFVTFPRIVREAAKLFFRRKLHVWYRPEVLRESIGRRESREEKAIASCFKAFLQAAVTMSELQIPINYTAAMSSGPESYYPSRLRDSLEYNFPNASTEAIDLKIGTPLFYGQLVRYSHISEFITNSLLTLPAESQTFYISNPQSFLKLLDARPESPLPKKGTPPISALNWLRWRFLLRLRNTFSQTHVTILRPRSSEWIAQDIRPFPLSMLDEFAQHSHDKVLATKYRKAVVKLLLSDIIAFGQPGLVDVFDWLVRVVLCYIFAMSLGLGTSLFPVAGTEVAMRTDVLNGSAALGKSVVGCFGIHMWWAFKALF